MMIKGNRGKKKKTIFNWDYEEPVKVLEVKVDSATEMALVRFEYIVLETNLNRMEMARKGSALVLTIPTITLTLTMAKKICEDTLKTLRILRCFPQFQLTTMMSRIAIVVTTIAPALTWNLA